MTLQSGKMYRPSSVAFDTGNDTVYVVEKFNHRISKWKYTPGSFDFILDAGQVTAIINLVGGSDFLNATTTVTFSAPDLDIANPVTATATAVVASDPTPGTITAINITDAGNGYSVAPTITITSSGAGEGASADATISTPWGTNGDGTTGQAGPISDGSPTDTSLDKPSEIVFDGTRLVVTDTFHNRIRTIATSDGAFIDSAGTGGFGDADFYHPAGIAVNDSQTFLVIADELNHRAVRYDVGATPSNPVVLTLPGPPSFLSFVRPHGVVYDVANDLFNVTDSARGLITQYPIDGLGAIQGQFGTPGATGHVPSSNGTELFFPSSGHGALTGHATITSLTTLAGVITGYTDGESITLSGGSGTGATATAIITGGTIQSVALVTGGSGYTASNVLTITGDISNTATATIVAATVVDGVTFADTRNNILKTLTIQDIANTTGTTAGTGNGQLYFPESVSSFSDTANYVLAANTLNNRVEAFSNAAAILTFQQQFGSP